MVGRWAVRTSEHFVSEIHQVLTPNPGRCIGVALFDVANGLDRLAVVCDAHLLSYEGALCEVRPETSLRVDERVFKGPFENWVSARTGNRTMDWEIVLVGASGCVSGFEPA